MTTSCQKLEIGVVNARTWAVRYATVAPKLATEEQLVDEARELSELPEVSLDALRTRISHMQQGLQALLREVSTPR